jgi:hypothetical protein
MPLVVNLKEYRETAVAGYLLAFLHMSMLDI